MQIKTMLTTITILTNALSKMKSFMHLIYTADDVNKYIDVITNTDDVTINREYT